MDTYQYVCMLADPLEVESALDIGCGDKGVIAQHYWENVRHIKRGYACDRFVLKPLPAIWTPLLNDAADLPSLVPDGVDVVTHCGMLEHVPYEHAFKVLHAVEQVARKLCFFTCSTELRQVDYKVKRDGNPYHYYRAWWDAKTFELLGYFVDRQRMAAGQTFRLEATGWFYPHDLAEPWETREARAKEHIASRRCCVPGCNAEPFAWDVREGNNCYCIVHYIENDPVRGKGHDIVWWLDQPNAAELLIDCVPQWRKEKLVAIGDRT